MRLPKRCPFCGDRPTSKIHVDTYIIQCDNNLCDVQPCASGDTEASALQKWNRRYRD